MQGTSADLAKQEANPAQPVPAETPAGSLISLLAGASRLTDLLPYLHQHALDVTGGTCSLLLEFNPRNGVLQATSGFGLDELRTDPWSAGPGAGKPLDSPAQRNGKR